MILAGYILICISAIFLILGIIFLLIGKSTWKCTEMVTGEVVGMCMNAYDYNNGGTGNIAAGIKVGASSSPTTQCPIFEYTVNDVKYNRASNVAWNKSHIKKKMNQPQNIYYNPLNPKQASLLKQSALSIIGKVFVPIGIGILILSLIIIGLESSK